VIPISHQTTWCRGTQQGLAYRQAREPRDKSYVSIMLDQLDFIPIMVTSLAILAFTLVGSIIVPRYNISNLLLYLLCYLLV
jgi:hypothetical protein